MAYEIISQLNLKKKICFLKSVIGTVAYVVRESARFLGHTGPETAMLLRGQLGTPNHSLNPYKKTSEVKTRETGNALT